MSDTYFKTNTAIQFHVLADISMLMFSIIKSPIPTIVGKKGQLFSCFVSMSLKKCPRPIIIQVKPSETNPLLFSGLELVGSRKKQGRGTQLNCEYNTDGSNNTVL